MSSTPKLTLSYFSLAGRAEATRLALASASIPFTNKVFSFPEFKESKSTFPLGQLPILDLDFGEGNTKSITQSSAILRYAGKLSGLYPEDDDVAACEIDVILSVLDDLRAPLSLSIQGAVKSLISEDTEFTADEKLGLRKRWMEKTLPLYLGFVEKKIAANSSGWVVGNNLSIADLAIYCDLTWISSGVLDGIPTNVLDPFPACVKLMEKVKSHDGVKKWTDNYSKPYSTFDFSP